MNRMISGILIFGLSLPAAFSANGQDPFNPKILGLQPAIVQQASTPPMLRRFSQAIIESKDTDQVKDQLFETLVFELVRHGEITAIEALAKRGDKLIYLDPHENTLLHVAARAGAVAMASLLIKNGLDVDADNRASRSPLFLAAESNQLGTAKLLLKSGANVEGNSQLSHPLSAAALNGHPEMVALLIEHGAKVNRRDVDGNTALHEAVMRGHYSIVEQLLQYDADTAAMNDAGQTPRSLAEIRLKESKVGKIAKRKWGTEQVYGPPDAQGGDDVRAWASKTQDNQAEWLIVQFENAVVPATLEIYENLGPKAVVKITVFDSEGKEHQTWAGNDPAQPGDNGVFVSKIKLDTKIKAKKFRIHIDSVAVRNWNEIDAVRLTAANGKQQWVSWAEASSCYASGDFPWKTHQRIHDLIVENR